MHRASMVHPARFTRASLQASRVPHSRRCVVHTPPTRARACETCEANRCQSQYGAEWRFGYVLNRRRRSIAKERDARGWTVMVSCTSHRNTDVQSRWTVGRDLENGTLVRWTVESDCGPLAIPISCYCAKADGQSRGLWATIARERDARGWTVEMDCGPFAIPEHGCTGCRGGYRGTPAHARCCRCSRCSRCSRC